MSATQLDVFDALEVKPTPTLQSILECLDSIPCINEGGCGIAALAVYRWCKKNGHTVSDRPFHLLWDWDEELEVRRNDTALRNGDLDAVNVPSHIVIELDDELFDSTGEYDLENSTDLEQEYRLNEEELLYLINHSGWNSFFRRAKHVSKIEFGLGVDLSDVKQ